MAAWKGVGHPSYLLATREEVQETAATRSGEPLSPLNMISIRSASDLKR
ncbi:hypothetical protein Q4511_06000 [Paracoccus sp. 1_MG-2023]|nr:MULTISPECIES: hypothetical protein [unclassified Paracoccus (in: a-proteobacteria)]MBU2958343.1 hypothetical protein [Paracoccus sp. C2R09]MDO6668470.1 hypothetical protein [Paracoccus sp. 1_MG-2023]